MSQTELIKLWQTLLKQYAKEKSDDVLNEGAKVEKELGCTGDVGKYSYFTRTKFFKDSLKNRKKELDKRG